MAMSELRRLGIPILLVLILLAASFAAACTSAVTVAPTGIADQVYISEISNTVLQVTSPDKSVVQPVKGDLAPAQNGTAFSTADTGTGYVRLGFPGQATVFMASGTDMVIKDPADEQTAIHLELDGGSLLAELPDSFPAGQRLAVDSPEGARVWITASMIGVQYDPSTHELYADCLKGHCGYTDAQGNHPLAEGAHVALNGNRVLDSGPGIRSELWQYIPNIVAPPTAVPSVTPNLAGTQACRYFTSLGLSCEGGFPTITTTPSPTPNYEATQACRRSQNLGTPCP